MIALFLFMTNQEKAIKAKELVGDKPPNKLFFHQINGAYHLIYGENMKRTCLNALIDAHRKIHNFIKAHENSSNNS